MTSHITITIVTKHNKSMIAFIGLVIYNIEKNVKVLDE